MTNKTKLGIFCPHSFNDYPFLRDLLNKKIDQIGLIVSNCSGYELPERFAKENNIPLLTYPIGKNLNVLKANDLIIRAADNILIIENGESKNNETVIKKCKAADKGYKVIEAPKNSYEKIYEEFKEWKDRMDKNIKEDELWGDYLHNKPSEGEKLFKIIEKL